MKRSVLTGFGYLLLAGCSLLPTLGWGQAVADQQAVLRQARASYYSLRDAGLSAFQCTLTPNWEPLLQGLRKQDAAAADRTMGTLRQLHFVVNLGSNGAVKLTHNELTGQNQTIMEGLHQIYSGMEQMHFGSICECYSCAPQRSQARYQKWRNPASLWGGPGTPRSPPS